MIDIHPIRFISLLPTPYDHFQFQVQFSAALAALGLPWLLTVLVMVLERQKKAEKATLVVQTAFWQKKC